MNNSRKVSSSPDPWCDFTLEDEDLQAVLDAPLPSQNRSELRSGERHTGFDNNAGDTWLYPSNLPQREYQLSIVKAALYNNTLVVLPTGLGKTFVASVLMYNIYRWYPTSKIIFMAPTRPLVAQQIDACQRVMPFSEEDTVELTGKLQRSRRATLWQTKRVFFTTPQVVQSDIGGADEAVNNRVDVNFPFEHIKLIVVDEAHRAKGRYAYTNVVQTIWRHNRYFRVLALSATPGRTMEDVAEVVRNLYISHIEVRSDTSADVLPYVHKRNMKTVVVPLGADLKAVREELLEIIDPYLRQLIDANVLGGSLTQINRNFLLFEQKRFRERSQHQRHPQQNTVSSNFSVCISLYHSLELLERHGMRVFLNYFEEDNEGRNKFVVNMERRLRNLLDRLRGELGPNPFEVSTRTMTNGQIAKMPDNLDFGHPKFELARTCVLEHFQAQPDSRAIVFCEYRESVMLVYRLLLQHVSLLRPRCFVGQGGSTGSLCALTQKQQIQIMQDFRSGKSNILVATSIGEEGLDVGEVELIVCFDISTSNPQRFIQRIGRTGRQKQGNVLMLVTEGREQQILQDVLIQKDQTNKKILQSTVVRSSLYKHAPRLVPTELNPKVIHTFIQPRTRKTVDSRTDINEKPNKTKKSSLKTKESERKGSKDLRNFFKKVPSPQSTQPAAEASQPGLETQQNLKECLNKIDDYFKAFEAPVTTNTQLLAPTPVATTSAPPQKSLQDSQLFRNLQKLMQKNRPLIPPKDRITDPVEQLKSSKVSDDGKRFILRAEPSIVKNVLDNMKLLDVLDMEADAMTAQETDVRHLYEIVEKLLGGTREAVEKFIDDVEMEEYMRECTNIRDDVFDISESEYEAACHAIFDGFEGESILCDNFDYIQEEVKKTERYKKMMAEREPVLDDDYTPVSQTPKPSESMVYETVILDEDVYGSSLTDTSIATESKLQNHCQWEDFTKNAPTTNKSTPMQDSLVSAFQRQMVKFGNKRREKGGKLFQQINETSSELKENEDDDLDVIFVSKTEATENIPDIHRKSVKIDVNSVENKTNTMSKFKSVDSSKDILNTSNSDSEPSTKMLAQSTENYLSELDLDLEAFLEPYPEENQSIIECNTREIQPNVDKHKHSCIAAATTSTLKFVINTATAGSGQASISCSSLSSSQKENADTTNLLAPRNANTTPQPLQVTTPKANTNLTQSPFTENKSVLKRDGRTTPPQQHSTLQQQYEMSPTLFDMYLQSVRGRGRFANSAALSKSISIAENHCSRSLKTFSSTAVHKKNSITVASDCVENLTSTSPTSSRRKLISSSDTSELDLKALDGSETECEELVETQLAPHMLDCETTPSKRKLAKSSSDSSALNVKTGDGLETECEEIAATQIPKRQLRQQRLKRRRFTDFIDDEALVVGSDESDEDLGIVCSQYAKDTMIVSSDEEETYDENAPTATQMHAHYLQSVKSPQHNAHGVFKIPAIREFNDRNEIFSQSACNEPSQYICDSFVVSEEDAEEQTQVQADTMSPLERAERILKERRRARKKLKKRRIQRPLDDSSDDDGN